MFTETAHSAIYKTQSCTDGFQPADDQDTHQLLTKLCCLLLMPDIRVRHQEIAALTVLSMQQLIGTIRFHDEAKKETKSYVKAESANHFGPHLMS